MQIFFKSPSDRKKWIYVAKEKLNGIQREFLERHQEYELAKQEMWSRFSGDYSGAEWRLDFGTGTIHIRERENHAQE